MESIKIRIRGREFEVIQGCPLKEKHNMLLNTPRSGPLLQTCRVCEYQLAGFKLAGKHRITEHLTAENLRCGYKPKPEKKGFDILVVDDEGSVHRIITYLLQKKSGEFRVHSAMDGEEAVRIYEELVEKGRKPSLVLMDARMPLMNGITATRRILSKHPETEIYVVTAYYDKKMIEEAIKAGAKEVLDKSLGFEKITKLISQALGKEKKG
ncbi:MAG: hypothetical protein DRO11_04955 [Methanobacteriota archaeon]|nr:MAG: hypothetical protein DRO11_04955 [Euryarchaeota archaeon]